MAFLTPSYGRNVRWRPSVSMFQWGFTSGTYESSDFRGVTHGVETSFLLAVEIVEMRIMQMLCACSRNFYNPTTGQIRSASTDDIA
jgi:hypothetical protein